MRKVPGVSLPDSPTWSTVRRSSVRKNGPCRKGLSKEQQDAGNLPHTERSPAKSHQTQRREAPLGVLRAAASCSSIHDQVRDVQVSLHDHGSTHALSDRLGAARIDGSVIESQNQPDIVPLSNFVHGGSDFVVDTVIL